MSVRQPTRRNSPHQPSPVSATLSTWTGNMIATTTTLPLPRPALVASGCTRRTK